jgi:hypothetical protein
VDSEAGEFFYIRAFAHVAEVVPELVIGIGAAVVPVCIVDAPDVAGVA